jgi:large subunit ribosomal protein L24
MMKIKKDDNVIVISGKSKGKKGKVIAFNKDKNRAFVSNVNMLKKYVRPNPQKNIKGGMVEKEGSIAISNLMYFCNECGKGVKLGYKITKDSKQRQCKECSTLIG